MTENTLFDQVSAGESSAEAVSTIPETTEAQQATNDQAIAKHGAPVQSPSSPEQQSPSVSNEGDVKSPWFLKEGVPGEGDRPEYLEKRYDSVEAQAKAYPELEKKLGAFTGAPETYKMDEISAREDFKFDAENPLLKNFMSFAKEKQMSQDAFENMLNMYADNAVQSAVPASQELEALGPNAKEQLTTLYNWANNNFTPETAQSLINFGTSAENIRTLQKIKEATSESRIPDTKASKQHRAEINEKKLQNMVADERYNTDPVYRDQVTEEFEKYYG